MSTLDNRTLLEVVRASRVVAVIRGDSAEHAADAARVLFREGIRLVEIALTTPGTLGAIASLAADVPEGSYLGAGTVCTLEDVDSVVAAGATFVVTPSVSESVPYAAGQGIPVLAGAFTPTEAYEAWRHGAAAVKLFPASAVGPGYLRALTEPFPQIPFLAVGGMGLQQLPEYIAAGALGIGAGGPLVGDGARGGSTEALAERARAFVSAARELEDAE
ncbi:bifunctional 4-hydroxy-2-oxoglutarate aldolase/2-dehydro-3-deoxy-phosphogluconate aldolase [Sinomonas notoginsengisoli]|uniref:bifunctional 4-hydroxy-2-oxoglutarate aldolase/2-dehydro-3-deoxy-phosphogluconate aldolase n=1 Tax=Sinomonas notoginsengisoli TaxID=1457311 RepID=UPI001F3990AB|nr:bifunctional 4-hydroxy-2-oxoglutarate aldolase/2-dehydro-3-deoxy-phosphogluconate aldolase [Sinomonas notoginsengisoli]